MKSYKFIISSILIITTTTFFACQKDDKTSNKQEAFTPNYTLAKTSNELKALRKDPNANIVKTLAQLNANIAISPLAKLSKDSLDLFRRSIVVRDGVGIVSLNYSVLEESLSFDDFATVMGMFGIDAKQGFWGFSKDPKIVQKLKGSVNKRLASEETDETVDDSGDDSEDLTDYKGYYCPYPHDCEKLKKHICMTGC